MLGRLIGRIDRALCAGEQHIIITAWRVDPDGRKQRCRLRDPDG